LDKCEVIIVIVVEEGGGGGVNEGVKGIKEWFLSLSLQLPSLLPLGNHCPFEEGEGFEEFHTQAHY
jgi:hypothetical protein